MPYARRRRNPMRTASRYRWIRYRNQMQGYRRLLRSQGYSRARRLAIVGRVASRRPFRY